jgi:hypothetical protein
MAPNRRFFSFVTSSIRKEYHLRSSYVICHMLIDYFYRHTKHTIEIQCKYLLHLPVRCFQNLYGTLTQPGLIYDVDFHVYETEHFKLYRTVTCFSGNSIDFMRIWQKISVQRTYFWFFIFSSNKNSSHFIVLLSHCFST